MTRPRRKGGVLSETASASISFVAPDVIRASHTKPKSSHLPSKLTAPILRDVNEVQTWFSEHVTLSGKSYTLDYDQASAVFDEHKNTLVTARAGSGKTRVIVAKIAYLIVIRGVELEEIAAFMFNRTAAAEVNERIGDVLVDGQSLQELSTGMISNQPISVASTFHKFALDLVKLSGMQPTLISEFEREQIISRSLFESIRESHIRIAPRERTELSKLVSSFIARAGQKYIGRQGLEHLATDVDNYCLKHANDPAARMALRTHRLALSAYHKYLTQLRAPKIDFNLLMSLAVDLLKHANEPQNAEGIKLLAKVRPFRYLLVDEYQDFSYLFLAIIQAIREVCPQAALFAVGDDWQAINRFAGSDVDYFINFAKYFPEDVINIPLMTNYRSDRRIVENANDYMLEHYDPKAKRAIPFSRQNGKLFRLNPSKIRYDASDIKEDGLGDARYQLALMRVIPQQSLGEQASRGSRTLRNSVRSQTSSTSLALQDRLIIPAARLLKSTIKIIKKHRYEQIMLLHRHNFTSIPGVTLAVFMDALRDLVIEEGIMNADAFNEQVRCLTMHRSKGLESDIVVILELNRELVLTGHPHAQLFEIFGDNAAAEKADQHRLLYVALTRAKHQLYILSNDKTPPA